MNFFVFFNFCLFRVHFAVAHAILSRPNRGYTVNCCQLLFLLCNDESIFFFAKDMHCLSAPRVLRKTSAAGDEFICWGNISLLPESQARACGFSTQVTLCKKHYDERQLKNKLKCCFPLRDDEDCCGNLVSCPTRLFPVFDSFKNVNTGTFICEAHLKLADKDKRICNNEAYTPPKKVRHSHLLILPSPGMLLCTTNQFVDV